MSGSDLERILKIINAVKKHECLWNVNCSDYARRDKLEKAWKDVAQEVGNTEIFCREKWRNVRTGFLRSIQHRSADDTKRKRFYLHHQMTFLLPAAEALEETRKKRKLSKEFSGIRKETNDDHNSNDIEGDTTNLTSYDKVEKFEINDDEDIEQESITINDNDEEEIEHHTLFINGDIYTDNDNTNNDIQKILKEIELKRIKNKNNIKRKKSIAEEQQQDLSLVHNQDIDATVVDKSISDKNKKSLTKDLNDDSMIKSNKTFDAIAKTLPETPQLDQRSDRDEEQLLYFFRGCVDDILSLNKQKQRLFKKRLLELIEELHDS